MIIKNCIKCKSCGDVITSEYKHDCKRCACGLVAVDGGQDYLKRYFTNSPDDFEELSIIKKDFQSSLQEKFSD